MEFYRNGFSCYQPSIEDAQKTLYTRQKNNYFIPRTLTDIGARTLNVMGPKQWNGLPIDIRNCGSINVFKSRLLTFLLGN